MPSDPIHSTDDSFEDYEPIGSEDEEPIGNAIAPKDDDLDLNGESETIDADETETVKHDESQDGGWEEVFRSDEATETRDSSDGGDAIIGGSASAEG